MSSEVLRLARTLSREAFCERFEGYFLVRSEAPVGLVGPRFETTTVTGATRPRAKSAESNEVQVIAVAKAAGNPYPDRISVGRAQNCDIVLRDASVSKLHAHFRRDDQGRLVVVDQRSQNGTAVNGSLLTPGAEEPVAARDEIVFGSVRTTLLDGPTLFDALQSLPG